jgi:hypothetical protein
MAPGGLAAGGPSVNHRTNVAASHCNRSLPFVAKVPWIAAGRRRPAVPYLRKEPANNLRLYGIHYPATAKAPTAVSGAMGDRLAIRSRPPPWRQRPLYRELRMRRGMEPARRRPERGARSGGTFVDGVGPVPPCPNSSLRAPAPPHPGDHTQKKSPEEDVVRGMPGQSVQSSVASQRRRGSSLDS